MFDEIYHDMLRDMNPGLYDAIKQLVEAGQKTRTIVRRVEKQADKGSVLPGLVKGTARTIKRNLG